MQIWLWQFHHYNCLCLSVAFVELNNLANVCKLWNSNRARHHPKSLKIYLRKFRPVLDFEQWHWLFGVELRFFAGNCYFNERFLGIVLYIATGDQIERDGVLFTRIGLLITVLLSWYAGVLSCGQKKAQIFVGFIPDKTFRFASRYPFPPLHTFPHTPQLSAAARPRSTVTTVITRFELTFTTFPHVWPTKTYKVKTLCFVQKRFWLVLISLSSRNFKNGYTFNLN